MFTTPGLSEQPASNEIRTNKHIFKTLQESHKLETSGLLHTFIGQ